MRLAFCLGVGLVVVACGSSGSSGGDADAGPNAISGTCEEGGSCSGCCDVGGTCRTGMIDTQCGTSGRACQNCNTVGQTCGGGVCGGAGSSSGSGSSSGASSGASSGTGSSSGAGPTACPMQMRCRQCFGAAATCCRMDGTCGCMTPGGCF